MRRYLLTCLAALLALILSPERAHAWVYWRLSVNIILDSNGNWPASTNGFNGYSSAAAIRAEFDDYNRLLSRMGWGFRVQLVGITELRNISQWFNVNARDGRNLMDLEAQAKQPQNWSAYNWRLDAINVYINNSSSGVAVGGPYLPAVGDGVFAGVNGYRTLILHEFGHTLGLHHTHGMCNDPVDCGYRWRDDDGAADTIRDYPGTNQNAIAVENFARNYNVLTSSQQRQVDNVFLNVMAYHGGGADRFTHDQWEIMVDASTFQRRNVTSGATVFVDWQASGWSLENLMNNLPYPAALYQDELDDNPPPGVTWGSRYCLSFEIDPPFPPKPPLYPASWPWPPTPAFPDPPPDYPAGWPWPPFDPGSFNACLGGPLKTVSDAVNSASAGDRLQIKAGNYNESVRITKAVTLTTDRGTVTIGR